MKDRTAYKHEKTVWDISGTDVLHQVDRHEGQTILDSQRVPNKVYRVSNYMASSQMKGCLSGPEKSAGGIEPKATLKGAGVIAPKDTWRPKAYQPHANDGN